MISVPMVNDNACHLDITKYHMAKRTKQSSVVIKTLPCRSGSRAGGIMATCWATMMYMGEDGYVEATRNIIQTTKYIETG